MKQDIPEYIFLEKKISLYKLFSIENHHFGPSGDTVIKYLARVRPVKPVARGPLFKARGPRPAYLFYKTAISEICVFYGTVG